MDPAVLALVWETATEVALPLISALRNELVANWETKMNAVLQSQMTRADRTMEMDNRNTSAMEDMKEVIKKLENDIKIEFNKVKGEMKKASSDDGDLDETIESAVVKKIAELRKNMDDKMDQKLEKFAMSIETKFTQILEGNGDVKSEREGGKRIPAKDAE